MNDPESLSENLEELTPSPPAQELEHKSPVDGVLGFEDELDILLNYDEEDEPRLRNTGELELPSPEDCLDAYQAVMLYNFLCTQANVPHLVFHPSDKSRPQLYDWFVSSLNLCPIGELLDQFIKRLAAWKKQSNALSEGINETELEEMGIYDSINWDEFPGLRA